MAVNHVELATGETLLDLRGDTVHAAVLQEGYTAHDAMGNPIVGAKPDSTNADTVDGLHAVVSETEATIDDKSVITFILGGE